MITMILKNKETVKFNLKNFDRDQSLYNAWFSMRETEKYKDKKFKITTEQGIFYYNINDIQSCLFEKFVFLQGYISTKKEKHETTSSFR